MTKKITITLNYNHQTTPCSWRSKSVQVDPGTTFADLAELVGSPQGICEFDPWTARATRGWNKDQKCQVRPGWSYHIKASAGKTEGKQRSDMASIF